MTDEVRLLTAEEVAAMRRDLPGVIGGGEAFQKRWDRERIVATLTALQAENALLKRTMGLGPPRPHPPDDTKPIDCAKVFRP